MDNIAIISAIIAILAAFIALISLIENRRIAKFTENYSLINQAESVMLEHHELLKLHNITEDMLKECDATPEEVIYLCLSINSSNVSSRIQKKAILSEYRKNMFTNEKVISIWKKIVRGRLASQDSPFAIALDKYIKEIGR